METTSHIMKNNNEKKQRKCQHGKSRQILNAKSKNLFFVCLLVCFYFNKAFLLTLFFPMFSFDSPENIRKCVVCLKSFTSVLVSIIQLTITCSKLTKETLENDVNDVVLMFLLLTLNISHTFSGAFIVDFNKRMLDEKVLSFRLLPIDYWLISLENVRGICLDLLNFIRFLKG